MDKYESEHKFTNIDQLMEHALGKLGAEGIGNKATDPSVHILIKPTGTFDADGDVEMQPVIYVGATDAEVGADLNPQPVAELAVPVNDTWKKK